MPAAASRTRSRPGERAQALGEPLGLDLGSLRRHRRDLEVPSEAFPTMTGFADGSSAEHLALLERRPPACAGRRRGRWSSPGRRSPHTWSRGDRPTSRIPPRRSTSRSASRRSPRRSTGPCTATTRRARATCRSRDWTRRSAPPCGASRRASCSSSSRSSSRGPSTSWTRTGPSTRSTSDGGHIEWKRKIGTLNASSPAYWDGRLFAVNLEPQQAVALERTRREQGALATPAARPQRVLAARPQRQGDLRLRVRRHLRPRREDRQGRAGRSTPAAR